MSEYDLNKDFLDMLSFFSSGTTGQPFKLEASINNKEVERFAREQGVWQIIFSVMDKVYNGKDNGKLNMTKSVYNGMLKSFFADSAMQIRRQNALNELYDALEKNQIEYCIIKGESMSHLYHQPSLRISSDTDIYIHEEDEKVVSDIIRKLHYEILPFYPTSHHLVAVHSVAGRVEIHLRFYSEKMENIWFGNKVFIKENYRKVKTSEGILIPTLGITDNLIFITLHFIKHFINFGVGIRQLMDILLYMKYYREVIDWERYNLLLDNLRYKKLICHLIGIGICYFNINSEDLPPCTYDEKVLTRILLDIQAGGIFGKNEQGRSSCHIPFTRARWEILREGSLDDYTKHFYRNQLKLIIPARVILEEEFSYVKAYPYMNTIANLHRIMRLLVMIIKGERIMTKFGLVEKNSDFKEVLDRRMELIKELEMI